MKSSGQIRRLMCSLMPVQALAVGLPAINSLLNSFIIGHFLGSEALAAMGFIVPLDLAVTLISVVLSTGSQIISGNSLGRGDGKRLNRIFNTTAAAAVLIGLLVTAVAFILPETIAGAVGARGDILPITASYIRGIAPGYAFAVLFACFLPFLQLERASGFCTASVATVLIVNTCGNLLNAVVLHGGTFGAGLATAIANLSAVLVCLPFFLFKSRLFGFSLKDCDFGVFRDILLHGYPAGVPNICAIVKCTVLNYCLFALGGTPALAALAIANNLNSGVASVIQGGYVGSVNLISSVLVGERDVQSLRELPKQAMTVGCPFFILVYLLIALTSRPISLLCGALPEQLTLYMTVICLYTLWLLTSPVKEISMTLYQAFNRHKLLTFFQVMNCMVYPCLCVLCGTYLFRSVTVICLCNVFAESCTILAFAVYYTIRRKRLPNSIFKLTDIPHTLSLPSAERFDRTLTTNEDVSAASEELISFCESKGLSPHDSKLCGLCVEEISVVSLQNNRGKKDFCIDLRVLHEDGGITILLRDNGRHFDPNEWLEMQSEEDPMRAVGVKFVVRQAKEIRYTATLGLNAVVVRI